MNKWFHWIPILVWKYFTQNQEEGLTMCSLNFKHSALNVYRFIVNLSYWNLSQCEDSMSPLQVCAQCWSTDLNLMRISSEESVSWVWSEPPVHQVCLNRTASLADDQLAFHLKEHQGSVKSVILIYPFKCVQGLYWLMAGEERSPKPSAVSLEAMSKLLNSCYSAILPAWVTNQSVGFDSSCPLTEIQIRSSNFSHEVKASRSLVKTFLCFCLVVWKFLLV